MVHGGASAAVGFVGRDREMVELIGGLDNAKAGRGRLFLLGGDPGIGKSRLADETAAQAQMLGFRALGTVLGGRGRAGVLALGPVAAGLCPRRRSRGASIPARKWRPLRRANPA